MAGSLAVVGNWNETRASIDEGVTMGTALAPVGDVTVDADRARNRKDHGPENLGFLSKLALNVLKRARPDISIRRKRKRSGWSDAFARSILGQMQ